MTPVSKTGPRRSDLEAIAVQNLLFRIFAVLIGLAPLLVLMLFLENWDFDSASFSSKKGTVSFHDEAGNAHTPLYKP